MLKYCIAILKLGWNIACTGQGVSLDGAAATRIKKASPPPASFKAEEATAGSASSGIQDWPLTQTQASALNLPRHPFIQAPIHR